jgi:hypothetical protein
MEKRQRLLLTVLSAGVGVVVAFTLVGFTMILAPTSTPTLTWSGPIAFNGVIPRGVGSSGPEGPTNCTILHVEFNASGPIVLWVAPGGADVGQNGTISQYWASSGPAQAGGLVVQIPPSSTGYRVVLFNPSSTVMLPSMQFETAEAAC